MFLARVGVRASDLRLFRIHAHDRVGVEILEILGNRRREIVILGKRRRREILVGNYAGDVNNILCVVSVLYVLNGVYC